MQLYDVLFLIEKLHFDVLRSRHLPDVIALYSCLLLLALFDLLINLVDPFERVFQLLQILLLLRMADIFELLLYVQNHMVVIRLPVFELYFSHQLLLVSQVHRE